jgi:Nucleotide modification associated domain 2
VRCIACGCSRLDPKGYKCAECGGAPGPRHEQCYVSEKTKDTPRAHVEELRRYGVTLEEYEPLGKSADYKGTIALALQIAESLRPGILRKLVGFLWELAIPHEEILRLRLDEPENISEITSGLGPPKRTKGRMIKHYVYRLDHDTGFAPHAQEHVCTLCGCKVSSVEAWARAGSWVIGIGGNGTGRSNLLIYAMLVESTPTVDELRGKAPDLISYLRGHEIEGDARILVSRFYYYFGKNAVALPQRLQSDLLFRGRGCKRVGNEAVVQLASHLRRKYPAPGVYGEPNNRYGKPISQCGCAK